jgi:hypothetical protein
LPAPIADTWDKQVAAINKVQRLPEGVEVNFCRMKGGRPSFEEELLFTNKTTELRKRSTNPVLEPEAVP